MGLDNPLHIAFLLIVLLLVFGARRLPEIGRSVGAGMREFKDSISGISHSETTPGPMLAQSAAQAPAQPVAHPQATAPAPVAQPQAAASSAPEQAAQPQGEPAQQA